jgi:hypothetical protein
MLSAPRLSVVKRLATAIPFAEIAEFVFSELFFSIFLSLVHFRLIVIVCAIIY